jgi:hypothetical protein
MTSLFIAEAQTTSSSIISWKVTLIVSWDMNHIVVADFLQNGSIINNKKHTGSF